MIDVEPIDKKPNQTFDCIKRMSAIAFNSITTFIFLGTLSGNVDCIDKD